MGLQGLERRLERMVEGVFARAFRSGLRPVELGRRLVREMDDQRSVDVRGRVIVPNVFSFGLSPDDRSQFADIEDVLVRELADAAREYARDEGYVFPGPVHVELRTDPSMKAGRFTLTGRLVEGVGGRAGGSIVLMTGERLELGEQVITIGRLPTSSVVVNDPNVSRRHAEIRPAGTGWEVVDLGSTNGTRVNGLTIASQQLRDGDEIMVGATRIRFEAS